MQYEDDTALAGLNSAQREAVSTDASRVLVLAGAGSGKTRVLVQRMIWQATRGIPLSKMLAVTFTNKAAGEIRTRIEAQLGMSSRGCWYGTFHGLAHRMLRLHWKEANLPESFQVIDTDDQQRIIKRLIRELRLDEKKYPYRKIAQRINACKDDGLQGALAEERLSDRYLGAQIKIYQAYEALCQQAGLVDFAELLLRAWSLLNNHPALLEHYQKRFQMLLVDEFQDTNAIQYRWITQLVSPETLLFVVGDDDQSIYGWRGARVENINRLERDCKPLQVFRLEQNYRSTGAILDLANKLIAHNPNRMPKTLWTDRSAGDGIGFYLAQNEYDEARYVVGTILQQLQKGSQYSDFAVLYRSNAQSQQFENQLLEMNVPYRIYGGLRFYERAEVKTALAYLRLVFNRSDDAAFDRIVNFPTRGIGDKTQNDVRLQAQNLGVSRWQALSAMIANGSFSGRAQQALIRFIDLIETLDAKFRSWPVADCCQEVIDGCGLSAHYAQEKGEQGRNRLENLQELINAAQYFDQQRDDENEPAGVQRTLIFLSQTALDAGDEKTDSSAEGVQLMTLHSAKGLEFDTVFLVGVEAGIFPNQMALDEDRLDEERRLCYVGITRARRLLHITCAAQRRFYGANEVSGPSQFMLEMGLVKTTARSSGMSPYAGASSTFAPAQAPRAYTAVPYATRSAAGGAYVGNANSPPSRTMRKPMEESASGAFRLGQDVEHPTFGPGVVLTLEGSGSRARVQVAFARCGSKWLMCEYANLKPL